MDIFLTFLYRKYSETIEQEKACVNDYVYSNNNDERIRDETSIIHTRRRMKLLQGIIDCYLKMKNDT